MSWQPSRFARLFGQSNPWNVELDRIWLRVSGAGTTLKASVDAVRHAEVRRGRIWTAIVLNVPNHGSVELRGMRHQDAAEFIRACATAIVELDRLNHLGRWYEQAGASLRSWWDEMTADWGALRDRWIPLETVRAWQNAKPSFDAGFLAALQEPLLQQFLSGMPEETHAAIRAWQYTDLDAAVVSRNETFLQRERTALAEFFDTVEKSPLTDEQIDAVVRFDNRVRVIAAAGSGKTSTMVARAGYTLKRRIAPPTQILMLAFNKKAAAELEERAKDRLGDVASGITARTFHRFGLDVIAEATGRKPTVAPDVAERSDNGTGRLRRIVDVLRDQDVEFRRAWDLFRLVYSVDLPPLGEEEDHEDWDKDTKETGFRTLAGEIVKSKEERLLANWLFYQGVTYEYERAYEHDTADSTYRQYRPDFYYPDIDAYHEHWAIGSNGQPPPQFLGYAEGMAWKQATHSENGTTLLQTTSASLRNGTAFDYLTRELTSRGIVLDENPYREAKGTVPVDDEDLVRFARMFLVHAKSNRLTIDDLKGRAGQLFGDSMRTHLFLAFFEKLYTGWDESLRRDGFIDFEDMLGHATDLIEAGQWSSPYTVVMVDEVQDSSVARARFVQALTNRPGIYLYAVGDDWQSINRFAGADLSVMAEFNKWFGEGPTVYLQRTFRSSQSICDVAGDFVTKNPTQLRKQVISTQREYPPTLRAVSATTPDEYSSVIDSYLQTLNQQLADTGEPASVYVLGRYRKNAEFIAGIDTSKYSNVKVEFSTIHAAKGKEADYVIVPGLVARGFPSAIQDDPLLALAMPNEESFPDAEERRLFYVALTRARRAAILLTVDRRESPFLIELIRDGHLELESKTGKTVHTKICPKCRGHRLVMRTNSRDQSKFLACPAYPACRHTENLPLKSSAHRASASS